MPTFKFKIIPNKLRKLGRLLKFTNSRIYLILQFSGFFARFQNSQIHLQTSQTLIKQVAKERFSFQSNSQSTQHIVLKTDSQHN